MTQAPRPVRLVFADLAFAAERLHVAAQAGFVVALVCALVWLVGLVDGRGGHAPLALGGCAAAVAAAYLTARGVRWAAGLLLAAYVGTGVALVALAAHPFYFGYLYLLAGWRVSDARYAFRLPGLRRELATASAARDVQTGDLYTVRDGDGYAVVKVLAADPDRVHVRQYALRHPARPWHVKSSTLERPAALGGPGAHAHLPLDRAEFLRWEPALLRTEPVAPGELDGLAAWRAVQGAGAPAG